MGSGDVQRVRRLDPEWAVRALAREASLQFRVEGTSTEGNVGAAYVRRDDGRMFVLTWQPGQDVGSWRSRQIATVEALRAEGYPAPATELLTDVPTDDGGPALLWVQELLPGQPPSQVDLQLLERLMGLNARQAGVLAGRPDVPLLRLYLRSDGPGFCLHDPLRDHGSRTSSLEGWVRRVGEELREGVLADTDAVHADFQPANLLVRDGDVTGVVDWDGAGRGDCRLDLVTLRFGLWPHARDDPAARRLDQVLDDMPAEVLRPLWAHMSLRMVDWAIRHYAPAEVDVWLDLAESRLD